MFVNFAKEQTDDDCLTHVVISNGAAQTRINPPAIHTQAPVTLPGSSKSPQHQDKSSDTKPKEGKSKKAKSSKSHADRDKSSSTAMTRLPQPVVTSQRSQRSSSSSNSSNIAVQGESSKSGGSKHKAESSSKDPSALFIVGSNTQESALWSYWGSTRGRRWKYKTLETQSVFTRSAQDNKVFKITNWNNEGKFIPSASKVVPSWYWLWCLFRHWQICSFILQCLVFLCHITNQRYSLFTLKVHIWCKA